MYLANPMRYLLLIIGCNRLPLSMNQPDAFACLPEYALQNIVDNFKFIFRYVIKNRSARAWILTELDQVASKNSPKRRW